MKTFAILVAAAFAANFTPMEAHNQQKISSIAQVDKKIYVSSENLYFGKEGIFWQTNQDTWIPVSSVNCDSQGIYLTRGGISWESWVCVSCRWRYSRQPSQCENPKCDSTTFEPECVDIYDRRS